MKVIVSTKASASLNLAPANIIEEISQNLQNIFNSRKKKTPYQRDMGLDIGVIDERIDVVMMYYQTEMSRQVKKYEPRVKVTSYKWFDSDVVNGNLVVDVEVEINEAYL